MHDLYVGLMSGTSVDSVDAVVVDFSKNKIKILNQDCYEIPYLIKKEILDNTKSSTINKKEITRLDKELGELFSRVINDVLKKTNLNHKQIKAIGSHGQTIKHSPNSKPPFSLQIGDPSIIAKKCKIPTVGDFRSGDVLSGGQGAPLAPLFHNYLLNLKKEDSLVINIGGIANISVLKTGSQDVIGYDIGPGNCLLDSWARFSKKGEFDKGGKWASTGKLNKRLLNIFLKEAYFEKDFPKSTGTDFFNIEWIKRKLKILGSFLKNKDVQATLLELTSKTIYLEIKKFNLSTNNIYICGGGIHNKELISNLENKLGCKTHSTQRLNINPDFMEAVCFAWLAKQRLNNITFELSNLTGSKGKVFLGRIWK